MRHVAIISLLVLLTGCSTSRQSQMPSAHKYENDSEALQVYLRAYGDGYKRGCLMITTDYSPPADMVYANSNSILQAAGVDGFNEGEQAAQKMMLKEMRALKKHQESKMTPNMTPEPN